GRARPRPGPPPRAAPWSRRRSRGRLRRLPRPRCALALEPGWRLSERGQACEAGAVWRTAVRRQLRGLPRADGQIVDVPGQQPGVTELPAQVGPDIEEESTPRRRMKTLGRGVESDLISIHRDEIL